MEFLKLCLRGAWRAISDMLDKFFDGLIYGAGFALGIGFMLVILEKVTP